MSEVFGRVETTEDKICEIMDLFCEVQAEICDEMVKQHDDLDDAFDDNMDGQMSVTQRSNAMTGQMTLENRIAKIGANLKSIQENLHEVVNSI